MVTLKMPMEQLNRYRDVIPNFDEFLSYMSTPLKVTARVNTLKTSVEEVERWFKKFDVRYTPMTWYRLGFRLDVERPGRLLLHHLGHIHLQEEISMVPALALDPKPDENVLDLCAAPGGKTTQIGSMMENKGFVLANEPSSSRIVALRANCERLGMINVVVTKYDGRFLPSFTFDRVLVDAPCSSEGMARRDSSSLRRSNPGRSKALSKLQVDLLRRAVNLTRPGGIIVYSTCTFAPEENECVVHEVLKGSKVDIVPFNLPGLLSSPGLTSWDDQFMSEELSCCARYYPHMNDTGGFFVAKLIKR